MLVQLWRTLFLLDFGRTTNLKYRFQHFLKGGRVNPAIPQNVRKESRAGDFRQDLAAVNFI
jgi:hypothetical protein